MENTFDPDAFLKQTATPPPKFDPDAFLGLNQYGSAVPQVTPEGKLIRQPDAIPTSRIGGFGRELAGLADTTLGSIAPGIIGPVTYAGARAFGASPEKATASSQAATAPFEKPFGRTFGVADTPEYRGEASQQLMDFIGKNVQKGSKWIAERTGVPEADVENMLGTALIAAPVGIKKGYQAAAPVVKKGIEAIPAVKSLRESRIAQSYERGVDIDTTKLANQYRIKLNPAEKNPTIGNKLGQAFVGDEDLNNRYSIDNQQRWVDISKDALGVTKETPLTSPAVFDKARSQPRFSEPYKKIEAVSNIEVPDSAFSKLDEAKSKPTFSSPEDAALVGRYIDDLKSELAKGGDGSKLLKSVQDLRQQAQSFYNSEKAGQAPAVGAKAKADAQMRAADVLDDIIYHNLPDAASKKAFLPARTAMADSYALQAATDFGTGLIDPSILAKMVKEKGDYMTGVAGDIGRIAANNPNVSKINAQYQPTTVQQFKRNTPGGLLGAAIGGIVSPNIEGVLTGTAVGGGINEIVRRAYANRMTSPEFQKANVMPPDYRNKLNPPMFNEPQVNMLRPVEPGQSNIVPFDPRNALLEPEIRPNFVFGQPSPLVDVQPVPPGAGPRRIGMDSPADVTARLRAEDARRTRMAQMAEAEGLSAEGRGRAPTSGEVLFDLDPITGQLRPASQGIRGATPETFQDYTATLRSAIDKMSGQTSSYTPTDTRRINTGRVYKSTTSEHKAGEPIYSYRNRAGETITEKGNRAFDMTAAEKVAFDKTRVDLAEVAPGFKALNDRAIADKMMDRNWVQETLQKARQKDAEFAEIERRARSPEMMGARADSAKNAEMLRQATEARDRVMSSIDLLEEQLRSLRPDTSRKQQGPKTRAAKRNALRGDDEIINKLVP
jgi:hypothetical protein